MNTLKNFNDYLNENKNDTISKLKNEINTSVNSVFPDSNNNIVVFSFENDKFDIKLEWNDLIGDNDISDKDKKSKSKKIVDNLSNHFSKITIEYGEDKINIKGTYKN